MADRRVTSIAMRRAIIADGWLPKVRAAARAVLERHVEQAAGLAGEGNQTPAAGLEEQWASETMAAQRPLTFAMALDGYGLGEIELGKSAPIAEMLMKRDPMADQTEHDLLVQRRLIPSVDKYLQATSRLETRTSMSLIDELMGEAGRAGMTSTEAARLILSRGLAQTVTRAELLARTLTIWSYNDGAQQAYVDAGIRRKQWLITQDDVTCEWCMTMRDKVTGILDAFQKAGTFQLGERELDLPFDIEHPPLHPSCRCALIVAD